MDFAPASGSARRHKTRVQEYYMRSEDNELQKVIVTKTNNRVIEQIGLGASPVSSHNAFKGPPSYFSKKSPEYSAHSSDNAPQNMLFSPKVDSPSFPPVVDAIERQLSATENSKPIIAQQGEIVDDIFRYDLVPLLRVNESPARTVEPELANSTNTPPYERFASVLEEETREQDGLAAMIALVKEAENKCLAAEDSVSEETSRRSSIASPTFLPNFIKTPNEPATPGNHCQNAEILEMPDFESCKQKERASFFPTRIPVEIHSKILRFGRGMYLDVDFVNKFEVSKSQYRKISYKFDKIKDEILVFSNEPDLIPAGISIEGYENQFVPEAEELLHYEVRLAPVMFTNELNDEMLLALHGFLNCYTFNSEFVKSKKITENEARKCKVTAMERVFFPVCEDMHWYGILFFLEDGQALLFDSFNQSSMDSREYKLVEQIIKEIFEISEVNACIVRIPAEKNAYDCGYAMFYVAYLLSHGLADAESIATKYDPQQLITVRYCLFSWFVQNSTVLPEENESTGSDSLEVVDEA